jgi:hypothetical protein
MLNIDYLCSTCQVCQMTKKNHSNKKYGLLMPKIAESDTESLDHGICGSVRSIYNKNHSHTSRNQTQVALKLLKSQISQQHPSWICFITPGWHVTREFNLLFDNGNNDEFKRPFKKCVCDTIITLMPNQLQITTEHPQLNAIIQ